MTPTTLTTMKIRNPRAVDRNGGKSHLLHGRQGVSYYCRAPSCFLPPSDFSSSYTASKRPSPVAVSYLSTDDDSEEEYGAKRGPKKLKKQNKNKKKQSRRKAVVDFDEPAEVRFSTRRAAKITNYNEDDDDDDEDSGFMQQLYPEEDTNATGIDLVLDHRPKGDLGKSKAHPPLAAKWAS